MNLNVKGVWLCMKYEIPEMIRSGGVAIPSSERSNCVIGINNE
jgi:hypothetical protein